MSKNNFKFVVVNQIPTGTAAADNLSIQMSRDYGREGWTLVAVTPIPDSSPPGMMLSFQKSLSESSS
ncbi:MAG: hypothetical protein IPN42_03050 [Methylococcaceae bacterium]|nr:hypothetical protein [Methylococcaceae bacterium]